MYLDMYDVYIETLIMYLKSKCDVSECGGMYPKGPKLRRYVLRHF